MKRFFRLFLLTFLVCARFPSLPKAAPVTAI